MVTRIGEQLLCKQGAAGSSPATSTKFSSCFASLAGKIVLPWKPNFPRRGKLCCLAQFAVNWTSSRATRSTQDCKQGASC